LESGGALSLAGIAASAQPFFAAMLRQLCPERPIVVVTDSLKAQESFQQDLETWMALEFQVPSSKLQVSESPSPILHPRRCSTPPGKSSRTKASCRPPMSSLNDWKLSSRCLPTWNLELGTWN